MEIDILQVEAKIRAGYRQVTAKYRQDDEIEVTTENHRRLAATLRQICQSFSRPIHVLDVGCGTGRYFHCLPHVERLTGLDISEEMLAAARHPVLGEQVTAARIELVRGNAYLRPFPEASFDFIYSLGMFGHGCPVTVDICNRFHHWLRAGGRLFFNAVDLAGLPLCHRVRRRIRAVVYPCLTRSWQRRLDEREQRSPFFSLTQRQLGLVLAASRFSHYHITSHRCQSPLWSGRHLECLAVKTT
jgi:SAM-dependent methyltransferase